MQELHTEQTTIQGIRFTSSAKSNDGKTHLQVTPANGRRVSYVNGAIPVFLDQMGVPSGRKLSDALESLLGMPVIYRESLAVDRETGEPVMSSRREGEQAVRRELLATGVVVDTDEDALSVDDLRAQEELAAESK